MRIRVEASETRPTYRMRISKRATARDCQCVIQYQSMIYFYFGNSSVGVRYGQDKLRDEHYDLIHMQRTVRVRWSTLQLGK